MAFLPGPAFLDGILGTVWTAIKWTVHFLVNIFKRFYSMLEGDNN